MKVLYFISLQLISCKVMNGFIIDLILDLIQLVYSERRCNTNNILEIYLTFQNVNATFNFYFCN